MNYHIEFTRTSRYFYGNAISDNGERIGKICVDLDSEDSTRYEKLCPGKKAAKIILVSTNVNVCHNGIATALLNKTIEELNDYILYLNVIPLIRTNKDKTKNELLKFYNKFGFKKYKNDICINTMVKY